MSNNLIKDLWFVKGTENRKSQACDLPQKVLGTTGYGKQNGDTVPSSTGWALTRGWKAAPASAVL